jgi:hypothetical protein
VDSHCVDCGDNKKGGCSCPRPLLKPAGFIPQADGDATGRHAPVLIDNPKLVDGGGYKASMDDPRKLPLWLVPVALILGVASVLGFGAKKYAANNWRRGMKYSEVFSALQRHLNAWIEGEDNDAESKMNHLWHAGCCLAFLIEYIAFPKLYAQFDDRFKRPDA